MATTSGQLTGSSRDEATARGLDVDEVPTELAVSAAGLRRLLLVVALALTIISFAGQVARRVWPGTPWLETTAALLNVSTEQTLPTLFASLGLLVLSVLAWSVGSVQGRQGGSPWWGRVAAAVPAFMAVDEFLMLHERMIDPMRRLLGTGGGWLYYTWVVPGFVLIVVVIAVGYRWLGSLGRVARRRTLLGAAVFVTGAVVLEVLAGRLVDGGSSSPTAWSVLNTLSSIEEFLEMAGVAVAAEGLLLGLARLRARVVAMP
jgi:hypothetical protein